MYMKISI